MDLNLPTSSTPRTDDEDSSSSTSSSTEPLLSPKGANWVPGAKKKKSSKKKSSSSSTRRGERKNSSKDLGIDLISVPDVCTFETEIEAEKCPTTKALVFSDRVEVTRFIKVPSISGRGEILVAGLPASIVSESLRTNCTSGNAVILEVSFETRPVIVPPGQEAQIHIEIKALKKQITVKNTEYEAFKKQRELYEIFLKRVEDLPKQSLAAKLPRFTDVDQVSNFFRFSERYEQSTTVIDQKLLEIQQELAELNTRLKINKDTVKNLKLRVNETKKVLCISIYAPTQGDVEMDLSYVISGASWKPYYDMRIISAEKKMEVNFYGIITQSTEENWKDVKLSLSTAVPQFEGSCPKLTAATLTLEEKYYYKSDFLLSPSSSSSSFSQKSFEFADEVGSLRLDDYGGAPPGGGGRLSAKSAPPPPPKMVVATAEVAESHTSATFGIPRTTTIPNDGKPHKVTIAILTIPIDLKFVVRPRISSHAFLEINATNDSVYPLLTGTANIFFDNSFLCSTTLPEDTSPQNKFKLFAGADDSVKVELLPVVLKTETSGLLTKVKIDTAEYITVIKNTKPVTISVLLEDQLPISTEDKIKVKLIEPDLSKMPNVKLDPRTNHVEWDITLPPDAQIRLPFKFHVEYPRDRALTLDDEE